MSTTLSRDLDSLADWRRNLDRRIEHFAGLLADQDVLDAEAAGLATTLRQRLATDRLVLAFVAEFSRGKSELINALFFADSGRRVLPATPGRTTMCPVELAWDAQESPLLSLLPIGTRRGGQPVSALRERGELWQHHVLPIADPLALAQVLEEVTRTQRVSMGEARELGLWNDEHPEDNPSRDENDQVEVPAWRHALINYPHPLLKRGLVVVDTPGLNAIGAEPELTLGLLPSAHAIVFLLAADTGVTRSDLSIWRDHLGDRSLERFVVLNKIDTLNDPLLDAGQVQAQIRQQCSSVSDTLGVPPQRVFPISAREALMARLGGNSGEHAGDGGLPALEHALAGELLPQRSAVIGRMVEDGVLVLQQRALRRLADRRRQVTEQLLDLRGLRGKSSAKLQLMSRRFETDAAAFEECMPRLSALRVVQARQLREVLHHLSSDRVRAEIARMQSDSEASFFKLGAGKAFTQLGTRLRALLDAASQGIAEIDQMLAASHRQLNADFGFSLAASPKPMLDGYRRELKRIEASYSRYFGITKLWRLSEPGFLTQFLQVLLSRLRVVFESAAVEIELWSKTATSQMESQLRERRRSLQHRREAFTRIQAAEGELEQRITEVEAQDQRLQQTSERIDAAVDALRILAASPPRAEAVTEPAPRLSLVHSAAGQASRGAA
ncbi:dynamin family protein [Aquabacterium sp.]|uniref:dynamin family protein n=1 Tax=Aquabacterium sp. TaxID=1872578 RepID=UPI002C6E50FC|nr:dynamin family protein [Aquabacterium sp.]HSW06256.1 dynamin family protein [Aquabacterium sp.]